MEAAYPVLQKAVTSYRASESSCRASFSLLPGGEAWKGC